MILEISPPPRAFAAKMERGAPDVCRRDEGRLVQVKGRAKHFCARLLVAGNDGTTGAYSFAR